MALLSTECPDLKLITRGKVTRRPCAAVADRPPVRDIYEVPGRDDALLFVATDRVSAFDVLMTNVSAPSRPPRLTVQGIKNKGKLLTQLSAFWFGETTDVVPNHLITTDLAEMPEAVRKYADQLEGRSMLVRKCQVLKVEAIVRQYLTGSAYAEYTRTGTIHGIKLPADLPESSRLSEALFTPSTKADIGDHDENVHPDRRVLSRE